MTPPPIAVISKNLIGHRLGTQGTDGIFLCSEHHRLEAIFPTLVRMVRLSAAVAE
jgi:hypothetical protein